MLKSKNVNLNSLLYWMLIIIVMMLPVISIGDNIGMYFDSVFPDYAATQILNPQSNQVRWFAAFPYLCQVYHGSVGVLISIVGILITGTTSVLQHHIINILLELIIIVLSNQLLIRYDVPNCVRKVALFILAVSPTVTTIALTQYYIEIPGTICTLFALLLFDTALKTKNISKQYLIFFFSFFALGLAFYSYYNYLFFFIGIFSLFVTSNKFDISKLEKTILACYAYLSGAVGYVAGFSQIGGKINENLYIILPIVSWILVWFVSLYMLYLLIRKRNKLAYIIASITVLFGIFLLIVSKNYITSTSESLNIFGSSASLFERITIIVKNTVNAITGISAENLMLQTQVTTGWWLLLFVFSLLTFIYLVLMICNKDYKNTINKHLLLGFIYLICCIAFATRMQTQHFIPLVFFMYLQLAMMADYVIKFVKEHCLKKINCAINSALVLISFLICFVLLNNRFLVINSVLQTGGRGYYTSQVNVLANEALNNKKQGKKEIYIFPEWGFMSEFDYLTMNNIPFSTNCDYDSINNYLNEGYDVNIVYWNRDEESNASDYMKLVDSIGNKHLINEYFNYEGDVVFYDLLILNES